jgi:hypothetical protein
MALYEDSTPLFSASGVRRPAPPGFGRRHLGPGASRSPLEIVASVFRAVIRTEDLEAIDLVLAVASKGSKDPQVAIGHEGLRASRGPAPRRPRRPAQPPGGHPA